MSLRSWRPGGFLFSACTHGIGAWSAKARSVRAAFVVTGDQVGAPLTRGALAVDHRSGRDREKPTAVIADHVHEREQHVR